jgi:hypothetical protein
LSSDSKGESCDSYQIDVIHVSVPSAEDNIELVNSVSKSFLITLPVTVLKHHKHRTKLPVKIDTGAEVSVMLRATYSKLTNDLFYKYVKSTNITMKNYDGHEIKSIGLTKFTNHGKKQYDQIHQLC